MFKKKAKTNPPGRQRQFMQHKNLVKKVTFVKQTERQLFVKIA